MRDAQPKYVDFVKQNRTVQQAQEIYEQRLADAFEVFDRFSSTFEPRSCPVCGDTRYTELESFHQKYNVVQCRVCITRFVNPAPSLEALSYYYNNCKCNVQLARILRSRVKTNNIILSERTAILMDLIKEILPHRKKVRLLEIGCSSGAFLAELKDALNKDALGSSVELYGVDIDEKAVSNPVDSDITLFADSAESFANSNDKKFDLVIHFELLEHLRDPFSFMVSVNKMLGHGGVCHLHTPNANGFDNTALGYNDFRPLAHGIFPPMHLQAFTPQNIIHFSLRAGFRVKQIDTPGNFDVDIVRRFITMKPDSAFSCIDQFSEQQLAIVQHWLKVLFASSHMRCTLIK